MRALFLFTLFALSACGHKDDAPAAVAATPAAIQSNNYQGGVCGDQVVSDYNTVRESCENPRSPREEYQCRKLAESFLQTYPQVSCSAQLQSSRDGQVHERQIEEREVRSMLEKQRDERGPGQGETHRR
jgi:hypothetical protein